MALVDNIISAYEFSNGALTTDSAGSNTLTNNNTVGNASDGIIGYCADFSNANTNKYLSSTTEPSMSAWSVSWWYKGYAELSGADTNNGQWSIGNDTSKICVSYMYQRSGGANRLVLDYRKYNTSDSYVFYSVDLGTTQHHFVATFDGSTMKLYLDDSQVGGDTSVSGGGSGSENGAGINIGRFNTTSISYTSSKIDEFYLWDRAITSTEVTALYNSGNGLQYPFTSSNIKTIKGLAYASVKTCKGLAIASVKTKKGLA